MVGSQWPEGGRGVEFVALPLGPVNVHRAGPFTTADDVVLARVGELPAAGGLVVALNADSYELGRVGRVDDDRVELWPLDPAQPVRRLARDGVVGTVILRWHADLG